MVDCFHLYSVLNCSAALVFAFTAFFVYEQYESGIDGTLGVLPNRFKESMIFFTTKLPGSISLVQHDSGSGHVGFRC